MRWQFWHKAIPHELSLEIIRAIHSRCRVAPETLEGTLMVEKPGYYGESPALHVRVFDPSLVNGKATSLKYEDLDEGGSHRKAILFEGHIFEGDSQHGRKVYMADRRPLRPLLKS